MHIEPKLLKLMQEKGLTIEKAAEKLNVSPKSLKKRFEQNKIRFTEVEQIVNILGHQVTIIEIT